MQTDQMTVSLRESRLVLERLMQVIRIDEGLVPMLRDCALYSAALGLSGFKNLTSHLGLLQGQRIKPLSLKREVGTSDAAAHVDCGGQHAWVVAPTLVDLAVDALTAADRPAVFIVEGVTQPHELHVCQALGEAHELEADVSEHNAAWRVAFRRATDTNRETTLERIISKGLPVERTLWWQLFHRANDALAPDSYESRRHAGPIIVDAEGHVIGRTDEDETDLSLLYTGATPLAETSAAAPSSSQESKENSC
ncbi:hypothetical protein [Paraburkholderia sp. SG-MS1]|uniref:hypothetical protein n=1 Tax=Paraburkholderia sp. SG-MS1 TaxID=2023741 RepID=UPI001932A5AC|nr:hypothetical protein [Paraburkholderia sp. SG-MS1]